MICSWIRGHNLGQGYEISLNVSIDLMQSQQKVKFLSITFNWANYNCSLMFGMTS